MKFFDCNGVVILECGNTIKIYDKGEIRTDVAMTEITLEEDEKLIGIRSNSGN